MNVLLVQPKYAYPRDVPLVVTMPLGLCYIAAVLRNRGHRVGILDCLAEGFRNREVSGGQVLFGLSDEAIAERIREFRPDVVGCSAMFSMQYPQARRLCGLVKQIDPRIVVVVGGIHATIQPAEVLADSAVDFVIRGEADYTFADLVDALEQKKDYSAIDGLGFRDGGKVVVRDKTTFIENLDDLPLPARDLLKIDCYYQAGLAHGFLLTSKRNVNLITSRGCPGGCIFCTIHLMWGRRFRARSPENVLAELDQVKRDFSARHVQFEDDNLTFDIPRAKQLFQGMIARKLNLSWTTPNGVAAWRMDEETLRLMKSAGCHYVKFAVESGSQRVLSDVIGKPQKIDEVIALIRFARRIGMKVGSFFVVGLPGETKQEMQASFDFPHQVRLDWVEYSIATPHYGTELRRLCEENRLLLAHDLSDLYARKGLVQTEDFTPAWLEQKVTQENRRYLKHLAFHQPMTLLSIGWQVFKRNPRFVLGYLRRLLGGERQT